MEVVVQGMAVPAEGVAEFQTAHGTEWLHRFVLHYLNELNSP